MTLERPEKSPQTDRLAPSATGRPVLFHLQLLSVHSNASTQQMSTSLLYASPASGHPDNRAWTSPPCRPEAITVLLEGVDRYNVQNLQVLEDYLVQDQVENDAYDCLANLAILKLFVLFFSSPLSRR